MLPTPFLDIPLMAVGKHLKILCQAPTTTQLQESVAAGVDRSYHCEVGGGGRVLVAFISRIYKGSGGK